MKHEKLTAMCPTVDDWYPNYPNDEVKVRCSLNLTFGNQGVWHRVSVWGDDDCGMEIDFHGTDKKDTAIQVYHMVLCNLPVSKTKLKLLGFKPA